ncbi:MAG: TusE/DsrC/DsvC family sulfur relay protein [Betaproteobacteria bacterium]|nr:TusE/DsrC/DsvC family sulfur relay protein [Betaproteobacteria bacterium]
MPKVNYREDAVNTANPYAIYTRKLMVDGREVLTDPEGYILNMDEWSEGYAVALAEQEGLALTDEHWQVIRFIREYYDEHNVQAPVRDMVKHFREVWGEARGNSRYLHDIFPMGGPQKQGNRLAGIRKTKGEH